MNPGNVQGMFFCWSQASRKMMKVQNLADYVLQGWLLDNVVHRTVAAREWDAVGAAIRAEVSELNGQNGEERLEMDAVQPDELCSGHIRIWRVDCPKAVIHIPVIDWRGAFEVAV